MFVYVQQVFIEVTPTNFDSLTEALTIDSIPPTEHQLVRVNGSNLLLLAPSKGAPVLAVKTWEHMSHPLWSQLNERGRLQLNLGFHAVTGMLAALLGRPAPLADQLTAMIVGKTLHNTGICVGSGAYIEACMRSKLFVYIAMYGEEEGRAKWDEYYKGCKFRAGEVL